MYKAFGRYHVDRSLRLIRTKAVIELCRAEIAEDWNRWRQSPKGFIQSTGSALFDGDALRSDCEWEAQSFASPRQILVDGRRPSRATGHRTDQQGRADPFPQKRRSKVDIIKIDLGEGTMDEFDRLESRRFC